MDRLAGVELHRVAQAIGHRDGVLGLLRELVPATDFADPAKLAAAIKALPLKLVAPRPLAGLVNAVLRRVAESGAKTLEELDAERLDTPTWLWSAWHAAHGPAVRAIAAAMQGDDFVRFLRPLLRAGPERGDYETLSIELGIAKGTLSVTVHRLQQRYRELVRAEILQTVANADDLDDELRHLLSILQS